MGTPQQTVTEVLKKIEPVEPATGSRKDDKFPERFLEPLKDGDQEIRLMNYNRTRELTRDDVEKMFDDYYDERGWDIEKGIPTRGKLEELDLKDVADDLEAGGYL